MTEKELQEFNNFVGTNKIRTQFLPVLEYICKLTKKLSVEEYATDEKTTSVQFSIIDDRFGYIEGRVCNDWTRPDSDELFFELWWDEENYCCLYNPIQMMNMIGILLGVVTITDGIKFHNTDIIDKYKTVRYSTDLFPINNL